MASRRKVLTGEHQKIPIGRTALSKLGLGFDSDEVVSSLSKLLPSPSVEPLGKDGKPVSKETLERLDSTSLALVMNLLGRKGECNTASLGQFVAMDPGVRELRLRNFINSIWTEGKWKSKPDEGQFEKGMFVSRGAHIESEMSQWEKAYSKLKSELTLREPNEAEKFGALKSAELTAHQKMFIRLTKKKTGEITPVDVERFHSYVTDLKGPALEALWRNANPDAVSMASLMHKVRFQQNPMFTKDEATILVSVTKPKPSKLPDLSWLAECFSTSFKEEKQKEMLVTIRREIWDGVSDGILSSARASAEYRTLLDFLGVPHATASVSFHPERGMCMASLNLEGNHATNDDSYTSFDIESGGKLMRFDAVFDGISGHNCGYIASGIAKETIEIAALAGWIISAEDVRKAVLLADLIINLEKKKYNAERMGTTVSVSFKDGKDFFGIHVGDSPIKILRKGKMIFSSRPHLLTGRLYSGLGIGPREIHINNSNTSKFKPETLEAGDDVLLMTDGLGEVLCDHEYPIVFDQFKDPKKGSRALVSLGGKRRDRDELYPLLCDCKPLEGKDDDIAFIRIRVED